MLLKYVSTLLPGALLASGLLFADDRKGDKDRDDRDRSSSMSDRRDRDGDTDKNASVGRVKEYTPGKKLVVDIDNAPDKSYDLSKSDPQVQIHPGIQVGSMVRVWEQDQNGRKFVHVARADQAMANGHGDRRGHANGRDRDTWIGKVKAYEPGRKLELDVDEGMDREFDLSSNDVSVSRIDPNIKVGDKVKVTATEQNGKKTLRVEAYRGHDADGKAGRDKPDRRY